MVRRPQPSTWISSPHRRRRSSRAWPLAELAARQGDLATARDHFEQVLASAPGHVAAQLGLASTLAELGLG